MRKPRLHAFAAAIALLAAFAPLAAQGADPSRLPIQGRWAGLFFGSGQSLEFELNVVEGGCLFSVPSQGLYGRPCVSLERRGAEIEVCLFDVPARAVLRGRIEDGSIRGVYESGGAKLSDFSLKPSVLPGREGLDYRVASGKAVLPGTLLLPNAAAFPGKVPAVLILADSGPVDRDGNNLSLLGRNDGLALLAKALAQVGIASLRYDKRGSGESYFLADRDGELVFEDFVRDAVMAAQALRADPRFSTLTVIGHGQGSLVGSVAAHRAGADAFVSLAGTGLPAWKTLQGQLEHRAVEEGGDAGKLKGEWERIIAELKAGRKAAKVDEALLAVFRPSVQDYLISWFSFDPKAEIAKLSVPVLIVLGGNDAIVGPDDAKALEEGAPSSREVFLPDMNHILKSVMPGTAANEASYSDPGFPLASGLQAVIGDFVKGLRGEKGGA